MIGYLVLALKFAAEDLERIPVHKKFQLRMGVMNVMDLLQSKKVVMYKNVQVLH